ncbi:endo-1,4-beta-xylanase [uncultured Pseudokineococcus sp.]|uniref:endo-1,4-beta-xylanase n=1 Tax=uncultured Pseudokineococcus sp. TaxID=1642928 RepID=UPI002625E3E5|nr:endo-1,4-beta-xylanase [uncultured Pseudokineococcus sp.]
MGRRRLGAGALALGVLAPMGVVLAPAAGAEPALVHETSFEDGPADWFGRGTAEVAVSTAQARTGEHSLLTTGRTAAWHGPALDGLDLMPPGTYEVEAWVRLAEGSGEDAVSLSVARTPQGGAAAFDSIAHQVAVTDSGWTRVGGSYEHGTASSQLELHLESPDPTQAYYLDDVRVVGEAAPPAESSRSDLRTDFESGLQGWGPRGAARVALTTDDAHEGATSLLATKREQSWQGPTLDVTSALAVGQTVEVSLWVRLAPGEAPTALNASIQRDRGTTTGYDDVAGASGVVTADAWTQLRGTYTLGTPVDRATLYVEGAAGVDFLLDDVAVLGATETPVQDVPGLADVLGADGVEHVGVAVDQRETVGRSAELIRRHYDAITPENDGKPAEIQPVEGQFTFEDLDRLLDFADENDVEVYGHVLVWHSQTPAWFFLDGDRPLTSSPEDQALLRSRMEAHVRAIAEHVDARYPDGDSPIWAMDVVNEVIADGPNGNPHDMRDSRWFQVLGEGFVDEAFRLADQHFPGVELFINDYNTEMPSKREDYLSLISALQERGVPIDGVGHQAHVDFARPVEWLDESMDAVTELDPTLLQAVTELDVNSSTENRGADVGSSGTYIAATDDLDAAAAEIGYYYRDLFAMLRTHSDSLESVTFWGISNARTWLRTWPNPRPWEQPLPFDDDLQVTPAYWGIVDPSQLPPRPADFLPPRFAGTERVEVVATDPDGTPVDYALPEARDTRDGVVTPTCAPAPGSLFPVGTTQVTCTATDSAGSTTAPTTFDVVVTAPATQAQLRSELRRDVVRARVGSTVTVPGALVNAGAGRLEGESYAQSCAQTNAGEDGAGAATLAPAAGTAERVARRDYGAGDGTALVLRGTAAAAGEVELTCTLTMQDEWGTELSTTTDVVVDVRG